MAIRKVVLQHIDPDKNQYRFYRLILPAGSRSVIKQWGRVHDHLTEYIEEFTTRQEAVEHFDSLEKEKRKDGYIDADDKVLPKNYRIYIPQAQKTMQSIDGQLSLFGEDFDD